jgi:hypothetical protein
MLGIGVNTDVSLRRLDVGGHHSQITSTQVDGKIVHRAVLRRQYYLPKGNPDLTNESFEEIKVELTL